LRLRVNSYVLAANKPVSLPILSASDRVSLSSSCDGSGLEHRSTEDGCVLSRAGGHRGFEVGPGGEEESRIDLPCELSWNVMALRLVALSMGRRSWSPSTGLSGEPISSGTAASRLGECRLLRLEVEDETVSCSSTSCVPLMYLRTIASVAASERDLEFDLSLLAFLGVQSGNEKIELVCLLLVAALLSIAGRGA